MEFFKAKDRFIGCVKLPDGAVHLMRREGSSLSLIPIRGFVFHCIYYFFFSLVSEYAFIC